MRLRRVRGKVGEHGGGKRETTKRILSARRTRKDEERREKREWEREREKANRGRERRRCRDYHIMVPRGRISCATT